MMPNAHTVLLSTPMMDFPTVVDVIRREMMSDREILEAILRMLETGESPIKVCQTIRQHLHNPEARRSPKPKIVGRTMRGAPVVWK